MLAVRSALKHDTMYYQRACNLIPIEYVYNFRFMHIPTQGHTNA